MALKVGTGAVTNAEVSRHSTSLLTMTVYNKLGYHWATSLLGFLTLVMLPFP